MVALRREGKESEEDGCCTQRVFAECSAERGRALSVLRCLRSVGRESLTPRLCDERIKSPILESPIGRWPFHFLAVVIIGSKMIREEVMNELEALKRGKAIFDFGMDGKNSGALLIRMEN